MFASTSTLHFLLLFLGIAIMKVDASLPIRLITHNIRYATTSPFTGEKPWADRRPLLLNELLYNTLYNQESFICLQEVLHNQLVDVMAGLGSEWEYIGVGRDDGKQAGEFSPIIWRKGVWSVESWKTVWLKEGDTTVPGKGWDAASIRILTLGTFKHKSSGVRVVGGCTHLDDQGATSRRESAKLILKTLDSATNSTDTTQRLPVFLGGDLNSDTSGDAFKILNAANSSLRDVKETSPWKYGDTGTFTGFLGKQSTEIDHVFVGPRSGSAWNVSGYAVLENRFEDGVYNSDHRAVVGDVVLRV